MNFHEYQLKSSITPNGEETSTTLYGSSVLFSKTDFALIYNDAFTQQITFTIVEVKPQNYCVGRLTLPLKWFQINSIITHDFPFHITTSIIKGSVMLSITIHLCENGAPAFSASPGCLLVRPKWNNQSLSQNVYQYPNPQQQISTYSSTQSYVNPQPPIQYPQQQIPTYSSPQLYVIPQIVPQGPVQILQQQAVQPIQSYQLPPQYITSNSIQMPIPQAQSQTQNLVKNSDQQAPISSNSQNSQSEINPSSISDLPPNYTINLQNQAQVTPPIQQSITSSIPPTQIQNNEIPGIPPTYTINHPQNQIQITPPIQQSVTSSIPPTQIQNNEIPIGIPPLYSTSAQPVIVSSIPAGIPPIAVPGQMKIQQPVPQAFPLGIPPISGQQQVPQGIPLYLMTSQGVQIVYAKPLQPITQISPVQQPVYPTISQQVQQIQQVPQIKINVEAVGNQNGEKIVKRAPAIKKGAERIETDQENSLQIPAEDEPEMTVSLGDVPCGELEDISVGRVFNVIGRAPSETKENLV